VTEVSGYGITAFGPYRTTIRPCIPTNPRKSTTVLWMVHRYRYVPGVVKVTGPNVDPAFCVGLAVNAEFW
jgi:hypothetical protein